MNALKQLPRLENRYYAMRHGQSRANTRGIIASRPEHALADYGLTDTGREQVAASLRRARQLGAETLILSSDFRRARETAEIAHAWLACSTPIGFDQRLRERGFGAHELQADSAYHDVWRHDELDADQRVDGVESPNQVMARVTAVIADCERRHRGRSLLLVAHGDVLQILQAAFAGTDASRHRGLEHLQTAEIRHLELLCGG